MFALLVPTDRSVQPEDQWPSGEATELKGSFTTFDAACEAARKSLSRKKEDYTYYNEGRTDDESVYSEHESDDEDFGHEDESDREEDDFCIRTFHDYGKRQAPSTCAITRRDMLCSKADVSLAYR